MINKAKLGDKFLCTSSASVGYKTGKVYPVVNNADNRLCFFSDDGFHDLLSMLVSSFVKVEEDVNEKAILSLVEKKKNGTLDTTKA